jgi:transposase
VEWLKGYTLSGVWSVLQRADLGLHSARVQLDSPDAAYLTKQAQLHDCLTEAARRPEAVSVLFLDEMGYYGWPDTAAEWAASAADPHLVAQRAGSGNRQQRVIGALNALTGQVDYMDNYIVGRQQLCQFYHRLAEAYPSAERVYVVQDNWSVHRHPDVTAALTQWPRWEPVWLPTYAPWLNPIEKLWRWLRHDILKLHRLADDWHALRARVNAFLDQFAAGSPDLLRYVGLSGDGQLARVIRSA